MSISEIGFKSTVPAPSAQVSSEPPQRPAARRMDGYEILSRITANVALPAAMAGGLTFGLAFLVPGPAAGELATWGAGALAAGAAGIAAAFGFERRSTTANH